MQLALCVSFLLLFFGFLLLLFPDAKRQIQSSTPQSVQLALKNNGVLLIRLGDKLNEGGNEFGGVLNAQDSSGCQAPFHFSSEFK